MEASLRRDLPIISTPHAKSHLANKPDDEAFTSVYDLDTYQSMLVDILPGATKVQLQQNKTELGRIPAMKVTAMPGKHVPQGILGTMNDLLKAVRCSDSKRLLAFNLELILSGSTHQWMDARAWIPI